MVVHQDMKLISESAAEDQLIYGLTNLLTDLGVDANGYLHKESIANVFWSSNDFILNLASVNAVTDEDKEALLFSLERELIEAMIKAGARVIKKRAEASPGVEFKLKHKM